MPCKRHDVNTLTGLDAFVAMMRLWLWLLVVVVLSLWADGCVLPQPAVAGTRDRK